MTKAIIMLFALTCAARAQGLLIPAERDLPPLAMRTHNVVVEVDHQTAVTRVEQVFENNTDKALEATYVFPVPAGAVMSSFALESNGVVTRGELMGKDEAKHVYGLGVSDGKSPARLDEGSDGAFRAVIYPIPAHGVQTLKLTFTHVLPRDGGLVWYEYPVPSGSASLAGGGYAFHMEGRVKAPLPIKNVYSPSHTVAVDRPAPAEARFRLDRATPLDRGLKIAYSVSDQDVGIDLIAQRPDASEPGYFMLLVSPGSARTQARRTPRDVVFVLDRSGSMAGEKIDQARRALRFCVNNLSDDDRFDVVTFSTDVETWRGQLASARTERPAALAWIDAIQPDGGTNVAAALDQAFRYPREAGRAPVVIFFTDGKPTLGDTTDSGALLAQVQARQAAAPTRARVFTWGLGYDLDTQLLDRLAEENGGVSEYVEPGEDLAVKVEAFHKKSAHPVLGELALSVDPGVQLVATYPRRLPELYAGGELVLMGRYRGDGRAKVRLTGRMNGAPETFEAEVEFPAQADRHPFVAQLWAKRRIGHLLDAIREHGEKRELVDRVVQLSAKHGVQTPYTSFLVKDAGVVVTQVAAAGPLLASSGPAPVEREELQASDGKAAVHAARFLARMKDAAVADEGFVPAPAGGFWAMACALAHRQGGLAATD